MDHVLNPIERYFAETGDKPSRLAERIGKAPSTITRVLRGERRPSMDLAEQIEKGTGGKLKAAEFLATCLARGEARPS